MNTEESQQPQTDDEHEENISADEHSRLLEEAFDLLSRGAFSNTGPIFQSLLSRWPGDEQALAILGEYASRSFRHRTVVFGFLETITPTDERIQSLITQLRSDEERALAILDQQLTAGLKAYAEREYEDASAILYQVVAAAPLDSEAAQKAKAYILDCEKHIDTGDASPKEWERLPLSAKEIHNQAQSQFRLSLYSEVEQLLQKGMDICAQHHVPYPRAWDKLMHRSRQLRECEELSKEGWKVLENSDDLGEVERLWKAASKANPDDARMKGLSESAHQARVVVEKIESALNKIEMLSPLERADHVIELSTTFLRDTGDLPSSRRVAAARNQLEKVALGLVDSLLDLAANSRESFGSSNSLEEKENYSKSEVEYLEKIRQLGAFDSRPYLSFSASDAASRLASVREAVGDLANADGFLKAGDSNRADQLLERVSSVCVSDPQYKRLAKELQSIHKQELYKLLDEGGPLGPLPRLMSLATRGGMPVIDPQVGDKLLNDILSQLTEEGMKLMIDRELHRPSRLKYALAGVGLFSMGGVLATIGQSLLGR